MLSVAVFQYNGEYAKGKPVGEQKTNGDKVMFGLLLALVVGEMSIDNTFSAMTRFDVAGEDWGVSEPDGESTLWWMTVCRADDPSKEYWSVKPTGAKSVEVRDVSGGREIVWRDFVGETSECLEEVCVRIRVDGEKTRWRIGAKIRPGWAVHACEFPRFVLKGDRGKGRDDRIVWGGGESGVIRDPAGLSVKEKPWTKGAPYDLIFQSRQPSNLAAQFFCRYDGDRLFYSACEDGEGHDKCVNCFRYKKDRRIVLSWRHLFWATERFSLPYDVVTAALRSKDGQPCDWYDAADLYKSWAVKQRWCRAPLLRRADVPALYKQAPAFLWFERKWLADPEKLKAFLQVAKRDSFGDAPAIAAIVGWEKWAAWCGPDYTPFFPTDEIAVDELKAMRAAGVRPFLWPSTFNYALKWRMPDYETGKRANPNDPFTFDHTADFLREGLDKIATRKKDGSYDRHVEWMGAGGTQATLCLGCPETTDWFIRSSVDPLMRRGATLLQYDQFNICTSTECWNKDHPHCLKTGSWRTACARRNLDIVTAAIRAYDPEGIIAFEGPNEQFVDKLAVQDTRDCRFFDGDWAHVFTYLYHEYVTPFQAGCHPSRFLYAKMAVEGQMPALPCRFPSAFDKDGRVLPEQADDYAFCCRWTKLYQGAGRPFLAYGRHVRPPAIECAHVTYRDVRWGVKIEMDQPAVFHAAFEAADGRRAVPLVNVTDAKQVGALVFKGGVRVPFEVGPREMKIVAVNQTAR